MSEYSDYAEHVRELDREQYIGILCWFTVADDLRVPHDLIENALTKVGLERHLPRVPANSDVFRRQCSSAQRRKVPTPTPDVFENYMLRDPGEAGGRILRRVVREQVDSQNHRLGYEEMAELIFDRQTSIASYRMLMGNGIGEEICRSVVGGYNRDRGSLNGYAIRELIRRVLVGANATNVRYPSGGVYFLSADHTPEVAALEEMAASLPPLEHKAYIHSLPLVDDRKQRDMLRRAFELESIDRSNALIAEIAELRRKGQKIGKDRYASYATALNDLRSKVGEYSQLLETGLSSASSSIHILERSVVGLLGNVK